MGFSSGFPEDPLDKALKVPRANGVGRRAKAEAERGDELLELLHLQRIGWFVDTVQRRHLVTIEMAGDGLVGHQHELLDDPMRDVALRRDDLFDHSFVVQHDLGLFQIEIDRSATTPSLVENLEQLPHRLEHRHEVAILRDRGLIMLGQDGVDLGVRHPCAAVDHAVVHLVPDDIAMAIDLHQARLHQPVDVGIQAAETGRQLRREHVDGTLRKVDGRAALVGFFVQRAAFGNVVRDVRDMDAQPIVTIRQPLDRDGIVEVTGVLAVDRHGLHGAKVRASLDVAFLDGAAKALRFLDGLGPVVVRQSVLPDDDLVVDARLVDVTKHLEDPAERAARGRRPSGDLDDDHVAGLRVLALPLRYEHIDDEPPVEGHQKAHSRFVDVESADDRRGTALEDAEDPALGAIVAGTLDTRHDAVAVHGLIQVAAGDENVAADPLHRPVRDDEPEAARVCLDSADHQIHAVRQTEPAAARLNQVTGRDEIFQQPLDGRSLIPGDLQPLQQLPGRRGMLDLVAHQGQQLFAIQHRVILLFPTTVPAPASINRVSATETAEPADLLLVRRAQAGDLDAFGELVDRNRRAVFRAALAAVGSVTEADDVAQEAFLTAFRKLETFRGESSFRTWLLAITWRKAIDRRKSISRWVARLASPRHASDFDEPLDIVEHLPATGPTQEDALLTTTQGQQLRKLIASLPKKLRIRCCWRALETTPTSRSPACLACRSER